MQQRVPIRDLRKNLKHHLDSGQTITIGGPHELRAFLISVPKHENWTDRARHKAIRAAKRAFLKVYRAELAA